MFHNICLWVLLWLYIELGNDKYVSKNNFLYKQVSNRQDKRPLKSLKHKQKNLLEKFSEIIRSNLTKIQRLKINALAVIEVHQRDIIDKLYKIGCNDINAFDWLSQLRFYWEKVGWNQVINFYLHK